MKSLERRVDMLDDPFKPTPVNRDNRILTNGQPVPKDNSHTKLRDDGQQEAYVVLTLAERAKGFIRPVRRTYVHTKCETATTMSLSLAETYARDPGFYNGTFCTKCKAHFPLNEFVWQEANESLET